ncbi:MAG: hypothetical protein IPN78_05810 [Candidatus Accumulibacter sp.]|nr:hypothetical protein [Candidatus Accumulibacter propinquus]
MIINPPTADVPAGDANTDTLLIAYGNGEGAPEGDVITAVNGIQLAVRRGKFPSVLRSGRRRPCRRRWPAAA